MTGGYARFAEEIGYTLGNDLHILRNGSRLLIK
jgi:ribonuclease J